MKFRLDDGRSNPVTVCLDQFLASRGLVTANSGGGKSYLLRGLTEQAAPHVQTIVLDREGEFSTLRRAVEEVQ